MATSLEELLAEEGFKAKKPSKMISRNSIGSHSVSMPLYRSKNESDTSDIRIKTHRTRSDVSRYSRKNNESPPLDRNRGSSRRARDNPVSREVLERRNSGYKATESKKLSRQSSVDIPENEIVEVGDDENESVKDIYANEVHHSSNRGKQRYSTSNSNDHKKGVKKIENYDIKSVASSHNSNNAEDRERNRRSDNERFSSEPALDEVAVQAMISILTSYIARFLKKEEFRTSLRHSCFSLLNVAEMENECESDNRIMANLEQAIDMVEGFAEETTNVRDLKKASLLLSVISGLNSNELKDGFTAGIPNSTLSACAHLYLSVIYKVQKKERVSAKHLLQVFCESPYLARAAFLPDLWENLFQPHLSHLKTWYNQEEESLTDSPSSLRKLKLLQKVYNQILDSGTYQFAVYYKDWLTQGIKTPPVPSILIPSTSVTTAELENSHGNSVESGGPSSTAFSPKLMVSKKLYESVFSRGSKPSMDEVEDEELEKSNDVFRSFDGSATGEIQEMNYPSERVKHMDQDIETDQTKDALESIPQPVDSYESSYFSSTPEEFICPLSRHLFEDPVTLETGQTFEREAIKEWFDQGNRTCPLENLKYSIYREEAVDAIAVALEESLTDTSVRDTCCRALLILGGYFSYSGEVSTERWMLKQAGYHKGCEVNALEIYEHGLRADDLSQLVS
ncbi:U-box domain [Dillenia turbinata]|uniref:U-box domain n=1 Tax=Dillenia turbinata TaxID=194707 RepID=A0AAN8ZK54_9MAGN